MQLTYNLLLFAITFAGGSIPLWTKGIDDRRMHLLLAFSGSFLLSITLLHLLPETFEELGSKAGIYLLAGFFIQLLIQRFTHGIEHGHVHLERHEHHISLTPILLGLGLHAFMEGLPLGFNYRLEATEPSLYMAVAAHKLPEAMLVTMLTMATKGKARAMVVLIGFSLITPVASIIAVALGENYYAMAQLVAALVPIVAGAFVHISTTIFFESGTRHHMLTWQKVMAMLIGVGIGLATLVLE